MYSCVDKILCFNLLFFPENLTFPSSSTISAQWFFDEGSNYGYKTVALPKGGRALIGEFLPNYDLPIRVDVFRVIKLLMLNLKDQKEFKHLFLAHHWFVVFPL